MGYKLLPKNSGVEPFEFGAFSFLVLLDACGYLFVCIRDGPRWYCNFPDDPRMEGEHPDGSGTVYPSIMGGGFDVTAEEACIMARMARNFASIQKTLPEENRSTGIPGKTYFNREDTMMQVLLNAMNLAGHPGPWPAKVRDDFTEKIAAFAEWAPQSGGFHIAFTLMVNGVNVAHTKEST